MGYFWSITEGRSEQDRKYGQASFGKAMPQKVIAKTGGKTAHERELPSDSKRNKKRIV